MAYLTQKIQAPLCTAIFLAAILTQCGPKGNPMEGIAFEDYPIYANNDLGLTCLEEGFELKVWAPSAAAVRVKIYDAPLEGKPLETKEMQSQDRGVWSANLGQNYAGKYYTVSSKIGRKWSEETTDPYAKAVGTNGERAHILDLNATDPEGWENDMRPPLNHFSDIVIYETHIRDLTVHPTSGIQNKGKYTGLSEINTKSPDGLYTGIAHIKELGATHVHLLPTADFSSIDETKDEGYNWGYDPKNYNVPEGSYSTDPSNGATRIKEFKEMVQGMHKQGLRVILDVVYNHTGELENSALNALVPNYFYRQDAAGKFSNASGCGNELASERAMVRKFIVESVSFWAKEYHIDGFRFDLMGVHDIETMRQVRKNLDDVDPKIFIYGEGWAAHDSPYPEDLRAMKTNGKEFPEISVFSDDLRDGLKGSVFASQDIGFVSGGKNKEESVKFGFIGGVEHPQIDIKQVGHSERFWATNPQQSINYVSCHDNHTLWDKLDLSKADDQEQMQIKRHLLAQSVVLTSQGIPFLHAGTEFLRSKNGNENSYNASDEVNAIDWTLKKKNEAVFEYIKNLIAFRKAHATLHTGDAKWIREYVNFQQTNGLICVHIRQTLPNDPAAEFFLVFNANENKKRIELPEGEWRPALFDNKFEMNQSLMSGVIEVPLMNTTIFVIDKNSEENGDLRANL